MVEAITIAERFRSPERDFRFFSKALITDHVQARMNHEVLVFDNDPVARDLLSRFLRANGFYVSVLHEIKDLRRRLEKKRPSVIVLDTMTPGTDGLATLAALRKSRDDIPIVLISARGAVEDRIAGLSLGC